MGNDKQQGKLKVEFSGQLCFHKHVCDGCHGEGQTILLIMPETRFRLDRESGKRKLRTNYIKSYYCRDCASQIEAVLLGTTWD